MLHREFWRQFDVQPLLEGDHQLDRRRRVEPLPAKLCVGSIRSRGRESVCAMWSRLHSVISSAVAWRGIFRGSFLKRWSR